MASPAEWNALLELEKHLERIESKLDQLISALADDDDKPQYTLDGEQLPTDRREGDEL